MSKKRSGSSRKSSRSSSGGKKSDTVASRAKASRTTPSEQAACEHDTRTQVGRKKLSDGSHYSTW